MRLNLSPIVFKDSFAEKLVVTEQYSLHIVTFA